MLASLNMTAAGGRDQLTRFVCLRKQTGSGPFQYREIARPRQFLLAVPGAERQSLLTVNRLATLAMEIRVLEYDQGCPLQCAF
jgi:hypothetical protein